MAARGARLWLSASSPVPKIDRQPHPELLLGEIPHGVVEDATVAVLDPRSGALSGEHPDPEAQSQRITGLPEAPESLLAHPSTHAEKRVDRELARRALPGKPGLQVDHVQAGYVGVSDLDLAAAEPRPGADERAAAKRHVGASRAIDGGRGAGNAQLDGARVDSRRRGGRCRG